MPELVKQEKQITAIATKLPANNAEWYTRHIETEISLFEASECRKKYVSAKVRLNRLRELHPKLSEHWNTTQNRLYRAQANEFQKFNAASLPSAKEVCEKATAGVK